MGRRRWLLKSFRRRSPRRSPYHRRRSRGRAGALGEVEGLPRDPLRTQRWKGRASRCVRSETADTGWKTARSSGLCQGDCDCRRVEIDACIFAACSPIAWGSATFRLTSNGVRCRAPASISITSSSTRMISQATGEPTRRTDGRAMVEAGAVAPLVMGGGVLLRDNSGIKRIASSSSAHSHSNGRVAVRPTETATEAASVASRLLGVQLHHPTPTRRRRVLGTTGEVVARCG